MTINPKTTCLVLDLDDTLYKEYDYQTSGLSYVERELSALYNIDLNNYLINLREKGVNDVFIEIMEQGWKKLWEGIEARIVEEVAPKKKFMGIVKKMGKIVTDDKVLYGFLFTAPNFIQESQKQSWKTYQERLYAILQSIIEEGIKKKEFIDLDPGLLMKAIGGLFHQLLISNDEELKEDDFEIMLKNFLQPTHVI